MSSSSEPGASRYYVNPYWRSDDTVEPIEGSQEAIKKGAQVERKETTTRSEVGGRAIPISSGQEQKVEAVPLTATSSSTTTATSSKETTSRGSDEFESAISLLVHHLPQLLDQIRHDFPLSHGHRSDHEPFAYEGVVGVAYMFHQLDAVWMSMMKLPTAAQSPTIQKLAKLAGQFQTLAYQYAKHAMELTEYEQQRARHALPITFFCGTSGVYAIMALTAMRAGDTKTAISAVHQLLELKSRIKEANLPDEILYGRAGYMYSLLLVHHHLSAEVSSKQHTKIDQLIDQIFDIIIDRGVNFHGKKHELCPMMWEWHNKKYLGAAHGVTGILYQLMQVSWRFDSQAPQSNQLRQLVLGTIDYCQSIRFPSGNFPSSEDDLFNVSDDRLVQFCHGAPGLALTCMKAYQVMGESAKYLLVAQELGEVVWKRGLLKKGLGLCHGIAGNGYIFLKLYEATHQSKYLERACQFATFALTSSHASALADQPDVPSSLGNGRSAFVCFAMDLLNKLCAQREHAHGAPKKPCHQVASSAAMSDECTPAEKPTPFRLVTFPGMDITE